MGRGGGGAGDGGGVRFVRCACSAACRARYAFADCGSVGTSVCAKGGKDSSSGESISEVRFTAGHDGTSTNDSRSQNRRAHNWHARRAVAARGAEKVVRG